MIHHEVRGESSPRNFGRYQFDGGFARSDGTFRQCDQTPAKFSLDCRSSCDEQRFMEPANGAIHARREDHPPCVGRVWLSRWRTKRNQIAGKISRGAGGGDLAS